MTRPTIVLFDIDGTLITTGGVGRRAIELTFRDLYDRVDACSHFRFDGMTDPAIMRMGLQAIGQVVTQSAVEALLSAYVGHLGREIAAAPAAGYRVHPGMHEAITLCQDAGHAVGLGTGNVRAGARLKLERVELFHRFSFGGFADDHEERDRLLAAGAKRGAEALGVDVAAARVVIIGDSPRDVSAAIAIGAECVGVGTGASTAAQLVACGATCAFDSLADPRAAAALMAG